MPVQQDKLPLYDTARNNCINAIKHPLPYFRTDAPVIKISSIIAKDKAAEDTPEYSLGSPRLIMLFNDFLSGPREKTLPPEKVIRELKIKP